MSAVKSGLKEPSEAFRLWWRLCLNLKIDDANSRIHIVVASHPSTTVQEERTEESSPGRGSEKRFPFHTDESWPCHRGPDHAGASIVFRLNGDYSPLHIALQILALARALALKASSHGWSTIGFVSRAVIRTTSGNDPTSFKLISLRFDAPVKPGDKVKTRIREVGKGPRGTAGVAFETRNLTTGEALLGGVGGVYS